MRLMLAAASALLLAACVTCDRDAQADGTYLVVTDCAGSGLVRGSLQVGPNSSPLASASFSTACQPEHEAGAPDGGTIDAGGEGDCLAAQAQASCPTTEAFGSRSLGLPAQVRPTGPRSFELYGAIGARYLECAPDSFGDEKLLFCRSEGRIACLAIVETP